MDEFRDYLIEKNIDSVSCFRWSGAIIRGFLGTDARNYANDLLRDYRRARDAGGSLSIVSKSAGGLIAEKALALLSGDVCIDLFLRIGVPDVRSNVAVDNVVRVANVMSLSDRLFRLGKLAVPHFVNGRVASCYVPTINVQLRALTHHALTQRTTLKDEDVEDATTYDLYWRLLNDEPPNGVACRHDMSS